MHKISSHDARSFTAGTLRARLLRLVFAAAAVALLAASLASARDLDTRERGLLPKGTTGVVVLDLSLSIADEDYAAVRKALERIVEDDVRVGLVVFSDVAYELLPPGTPSAELRPLFRFLKVPPDELTAPPVNPWTSGFRAGTRISSALELAQDMLVRDGIQNPSILLVSDLETAPEDVPLLARTVDGLRRTNIEFEVAALGPSSDAQTLFSEFLADSPFALPSEEEEASGPTSESTYGTPNALLVLGALLFAALALHERFGARLALPLVPRQTRGAA
jgi:von Willebrand factor type A domain